MKVSIISKWDFSWKMPFNQGLSIPAQDVLFSRKESSNSYDHKPQQYSGRKCVLSKEPRILLDEKLNFWQQVDSTILKINKSISLIKKT